jgi:cyclophilin family peptidyl-prolyl cis-trans isomerase
MQPRILCSLLFALLLAAPTALHAGGAVECDPPTTSARRLAAIETVLGTMRIRLFDQPGEAPVSVDNFLAYAQRGDYDGSFFHRLEPGFVLQGGGYTWGPVAGYQEIPTDPPIANESGICNVRGTLGMARTSDPNSATSQFFFNLGDNSLALGQGDGYAVFAAVVPEDLAILDQIAALHRESGSWFLDDPIAPALANLPVLEILERNPEGWGCIQSLAPDPIFDPSYGWYPMFEQACGPNSDDVTLFQAGLALARADFTPQFPERLVTILTVPEPGSALQLAAGAATLGGLWLVRRRRSAWLQRG